MTIATLIFEGQRSELTKIEGSTVCDHSAEYVMVDYLMILIIMTIENNTKNGIAINHIIKTVTKGKQAAAA